MMHQLRQSTTNFSNCQDCLQIIGFLHLPNPNLTFASIPHSLFMYIADQLNTVLSILTKVSGRKSEQGILYSGLYSGK